MKNGPLKQQKEKDVTRLVFMAFFFLFHLILTTQPIPFIGMDKRWLPKEYAILLSLNVSIIGFWLALEVFEFWAWNYEWRTLRQGILITLVRCLPVIGLVVFYPRNIVGMMRLLAPLLTFYSCLIFERGWSYVAVALFCCAQLFLFVAIPPPENVINARNSYSVVILLYQLMSIVLMFLFAQFWKEDKKIQKQRALLAAKIRENQEELKLYASKVSQAVALEERTRIARDIHDNLGHTLAAISIQLNKAEAYFAKNPAISLEAITDARSSMHEAMLDIRSTLDTLNTQYESFDLREQVRKLLMNLTRAGISVISNIEGSEVGFNISVLFALYRFIQEGVTNIIKHSGAKAVRMEIVLGIDNVRAELCDDGIGFDTRILQDQTNKGFRYGLAGLADRISLVRGNFSVESRPGKGTTIKAIMPRDPVTIMDEWSSDAS